MFPTPPPPCQGVDSTEQNGVDDQAITSWPQISKDRALEEAAADDSGPVRVKFCEAASGSPNGDRVKAMLGNYGDARDAWPTPQRRGHWRMCAPH